MVVPNIIESDVTIEIRLFWRGENRIVGGTKAVDVIGANVLVMEIADIHVNERIVFANAIKNIARRAGLSAGGPCDLE